MESDRWAPNCSLTGRFFKIPFSLLKKVIEDRIYRALTLLLNHDLFTHTSCFIRWCCGSLQSYQRFGTYDSSGNHWSSFMVQLELCFAREDKLTAAYIGCSRVLGLPINFGSPFDMFLIFETTKALSSLATPSPSPSCFNYLDLTQTDNGSHCFNSRGL